MSWQCLLGDNEWCTEDDPCFTCATALHDELCRGDEGCLTCKARSLQVGPAVGMESRGRKFAPLGSKNNNSWERGIARDARGMPLLKGDGEFIGVKEYGERRHELEAVRDRLATDPHVFATKE